MLPVLLLGLLAFGVYRWRGAQRTETPPPHPDRLQVVSVQPVAGDPQAFLIVARMSRADGGPVLGAFEIQVDLRDPSTGQPLLRRQCGFTMQDASDGRSAEITLTDRLPALPARPVQAQVWVQNRWVPPRERTLWNLWQVTQSILPHPWPQSAPSAPLTSPVALPVGVPRIAPTVREADPSAHPRAVRSLLWRAPRHWIALRS